MADIIIRLFLAVYVVVTLVWLVAMFVRLTKLEKQYREVSDLLANYQYPWDTGKRYIPLERDDYMH